MAYKNFIPSVWAEAIERNLEGNYVFVEDCNRKYEGDVKKMGESVTILGVGSPTIKTITRADASNTIDPAETIEGTSVTMYINQMRYYNYEVGDVDKAQAVDGLMDALSAETSEKLAAEVDKYIAKKVVDDNVAKVFNEAQTVTVENVLELLDEAVRKLYENNVSTSTKIVATVSPRFYMLFRRAYIGKDTDNSKELKNGKVGMYGNITIKMSNNSYTDANGEHIMFRTQRAVAFAQPMTHTEAYRPEQKFADAVKGYILFDAKVVRPKEIVDLNVKYA